MKNLKTLPIINTLLILALIIITCFRIVNESKNELVYVDNVKLFNEFNMTKEIMSIEENKMTLRKKALDSLLGLYNIVNDKTSIQAIDLQSKISIKNENLKTLQSEFSNTIPNKIWSRLNAYIKDYGKQKEVKIIFGISGNGNIMYADETNLDVTEELLKYINDRYEGKSLSL